MMAVAIILLLVCAMSATMTGVVRNFALRHALLDTPNERSSHVVPTPRGGGAAIAAAIAGGLLALLLLRLADGRMVAALLGGGAIVSFVGWLDDRRNLGIGVRLLAHALAALAVVAACGGMPDLDLGNSSLHLGWAGSALAVLAIIWLTNLYNFMDGIDGLAAGQAVVAGAAAAALLAFAGAPGLAAATLVVAAAAAGFLPWNWSPARIFMGDVGSSLLGFLFAAIAIFSESRGAMPALIWALLLGVFIFDATATLLRRALAGETWYAAHRTHAYQRAVQSGRTHASVTLRALVVSALLAALAAAAVVRPAAQQVVLAGAALLLAAIYVAVERIAPMRLQRADQAGTLKAG